MTAAFFLGENVHFSLELLVGRDALGSGKNLAAFHVVTLGAAKQGADVVASLTLVKQLAEHFHAGAGGLDGGLDTHDFNFFANLDDTAFHTTGNNSTTARDGEHVFDGHQEGLVDVAFRFGDEVVASLQKVKNALGFGRVGVVAFQSLKGGTANNGNFIAGEVVAGEQFANFEFHEFQQFFVVNQVALVQEHHELGHADLTGKQDVLTGLGHGAVSGCNHQDTAVHLGSAGDHVLDVVGVAGAVNVGIVTVGGFVFHVCGGNGDAAFLFFGGLVDFVIRNELARALQAGDLGDGGGKGGLAMVDVADGADVYMGLFTFEFFLAHCTSPWRKKCLRFTCVTKFYLRICIEL